jgi:apolipoprotein D and lipocalin family protein
MKRSSNSSMFGTLLIALSLSIAGCASYKGGPVGNVAVPQPSKPVEIDRYLGTWYEIGRYEAPFQKDCEAVSAVYSRNADGTIKVVNSCRKGSLQGKLSVANGKAKLVGDSKGAKLRVSFFGPFYGDYWVLDRADDYSWAIVGEPSGRYLWMLSRDAKPNSAKSDLIRRRVEQLGYDWSLVRITKH